MKLTYPRAMIAAAMGGGLDTVDYATDETFGLAVPQTCPGVPPELLNPRSTWAEPKAFDAAAKHLANLFRENFHPLESLASKAIMEGAPIS